MYSYNCLIQYLKSTPKQSILHIIIVQYLYMYMFCFIFHSTDIDKKTEKKENKNVTGYTI